MTGNPLTNKGDKLQKAMKVATLPKHATTSDMRRMLERKARENAIREANDTKKLVDRLLAKRTRKIVPSYRDKALVSSGTGANISMSQENREKLKAMLFKTGVENGVFTEKDAAKLSVFLDIYYSSTKAKTS